MLELPFLDELIDKKVATIVAAARAEARAETRAETRAEDILDFLEGRFGTRPDDLAEELQALGEQELKALNRFAAVCPDLDAFRARVHGAK
jgi:hypothetical protein